MAKQYRNVYTILEKVKKGEIQSYYKDGDGLFGKINFYKKPDLIKPHLHHLDEKRLEIMMQTHLNDMNAYNDFIIRNKPIFLKNNLEVGNFCNQVREVYRGFPEHITRDIFKMFYNKIDDIDFVPRDEKNQPKYKFLEKANNPVAKIMSEKNSLKSAIFARNIMTFYCMQLALMQLINNDQAEEIMNGLNDESSEFNSDAISDAISKMLDDKAATQGLNQAVEDASKLCKDLDKNLDGEMQETMFENVINGSDAGKINKHYLETINKNLDKIKMSLGSVKEKIKKLLDRSMNYFGSRNETEFENILDSDNLNGLEEFVLLHPKIRKIFIEDVDVKNQKKVGKIDLYIDVSGSMGESCGLTDEQGNYITKEDFSKAFAAQLLKLDILNNIYKFDASVSTVKKDVVSIALLDANGGTSINNVIKRIEKEGVNAIIITDAEDSCAMYSDKAFFIGVNGCKFDLFSKPVLKQFTENDQAVLFDGDKIVKIGSNGSPIF